MSEPGREEPVAVAEVGRLPAGRVLPDPASMSVVLVETAVVICLAVLADLSFAMTTWLEPDAQNVSTFLQSVVYLIFRSIQIGAPVLYLIWRSGEAWGAFGIRRFSFVPDVVGAVFLLVAWYVGYYVLSFVFWHGLYAVSESWYGQAYRWYIQGTTAFTFQGPRSRLDLVLLGAMAMFNGFAEELVVRAYLIPRFERIFGATWKALLLSTGLFAAYHVYQGVAATIPIATVGLLLGLAFCVWRRLWPIALAHALFDIIGFLQV